MIFEFDNQLKPQAEIDIDDLGELAIEASNDAGEFFYLVIRTNLGMSYVATEGPIYPDTDLLPSGYTSTLTKVAYKEDKLIKIINYFLNDRSAKITSAKMITFNEAMAQFKNLKIFMMTCQEELQ